MGECGNRVEKLPLLPGPAFDDEIRAVHGTVAGFDLIALRQLLHGRQKLVLFAFPVHVDNQKDTCAAFRDQFEKEEKDGYNDGNEQGELIVARAENDSDADGPEKEKHILRFLDGGTEADDGQRAHHTEGNDQIRLHRQDDACRYDGQNAEHDVELLVVKALFLRQIIDCVDVNAEQDGDAKRDADGSCGQRVVFHRFQNGVFDDILEAHLKNTFLFIHSLMRRLSALESGERALLPYGSAQRMASAEHIFGKGDPFQLSCVQRASDEAWKEFVIFYLHDMPSGGHDGPFGQRAVRKAEHISGGSQVPVKGDADVSFLTGIGGPFILHDGLRQKSVQEHFRLQKCEQRPVPA